MQARMASIQTWELTITWPIISRRRAPGLPRRSETTNPTTRMPSRTSKKRRNPRKRRTNSKAGRIRNMRPNARMRQYIGFNSGRADECQAETL